LNDDIMPRMVKWRAEALAGLSALPQSPDALPKINRCGQRGRKQVALRR